jgi:HSP20 family molecular chaperone IbpA
MSVYADCKDSFRMLARIASKSIADPPWFAVPVDAQEDQDSVTVYFHVPGKNRNELRVQASDQSVTVRGGRAHEERSPMRLCALPCPVVADQIETTQDGDLLRVRMPKKRPAADSRETSAAT